ncbi:MAG: MarR family transcriptional regulator [Actinomycetota bacterium]
MGRESDLHRDLYEAIRLVRPIHLNVHRFVEHLLSDGELSVSTRAVLEATIQLEAATTAELGRHLSLKRQQVERTVGPLADLGLIAGEQDPTDRRARRWRPTSGGREVFAAIHRTEVVAVADLCRDLDPDDIAVAARVMAVIDERLRAAVHEIDGGGIVR